MFEQRVPTSVCEQAFKQQSQSKGGPAASSGTGQPSAQQDPYADVYAKEVRRQKLDEFGQKLDEFSRNVRLIYRAIGCGVIIEHRVADGLLGQRKGLIWPMPGSPLFDPNAKPGYSGIPPETADALFMEARRAGLSDAGADPDAPIVSEFVLNMLGFPRMAIPMYSGPIVNNCAYWREHPEEVVAVRQLADFFNRRASGGRLGYQ